MSISIISSRAVRHLAAIAALILWHSTATGQDAGATQFEMQVRPLLAKNCWGCHRQTALGGLRMDSREAILKGGHSGPAIVPGKAAESLLIQAVTHRHERLKMPPAGKLSDSEIAILKNWIDSNAFWPAEEKTATAKPVKGEYEITPEQRAYWAYQPIKSATPPGTKGAIDSLVGAALQSKGLKPSPPADKRTLIRRATLDLTGLPPSPSEVADYLKDTSPGAFAKVIDRLLASPAYGERWGRHWLDVARYSDDSLSPSPNAAAYPNAYRYRNWVIQALNKDMPYNLFVKAQLAGDSLPSKDPNEYAAGLGFYALSPEMQDDRVDVTTRGFLGLTVACAQCHDHKFDPIPTKDFYSLQGIFASSQPTELPLAPKDVVDAWQSQDKKIKKQQQVIDQFYRTQQEQLARILASRTSRYLLAAAEIDSKDGLDEETLERWRNYLKEPRKDHPFLAKWLELVGRKAPAEEMRPAAVAFQTALLAVLDEQNEVEEKNKITLSRIEGRSAATTAMASLPRDKFMLWRDVFAKSETDAGDYFRTPDGVLYYSATKIGRFLQGQWKEYADDQKKVLAALKSELPAKYPFLQTIKDRDKPADIRIQIRGDRNNLGDVAPRRFLAILASGERKPFTDGSGRKELADHIVDPKNPLTPRVIVNRVWQHHFGRGIVPTASNFGLNGERPSHPDLLDYLASSFLQSGWSLKALHREIMGSATYQSSATPSSDATAKDPQNIYLSHFSRQRLEVESLRDSILFVSGLLDRTPGERAQRFDEENHKRTVYGFVSRRRIDGLLTLFDFPNPNSTSEGRLATNVPLQRLFFMNSVFVDNAAQALAKRVEDATDGRVQAMYRLLFGRAPDAEELRLGLEYIARDGAGSYARVLLSSNEFNYVD
jgi:mono/diheme cytochrome c family protein